MLVAKNPSSQNDRLSEQTTFSKILKPLGAVVNNTVLQRLPLNFSTNDTVIFSFGVISAFFFTFLILCFTVLVLNIFEFQILSWPKYDGIWIEMRAFDVSRNSSSVFDIFGELSPRSPLFDIFTILLSRLSYDSGSIAVVYQLFCFCLAIIGIYRLFCVELNSTIAFTTSSFIFLSALFVSRETFGFVDLNLNMQALFLMVFIASSSISFFNKQTIQNSVVLSLSLILFTLHRPIMIPMLGIVSIYFFIVAVVQKKSLQFWSASIFVVLTAAVIDAIFLLPNAGSLIKYYSGNYDFFAPIGIDGSWGRFNDQILTQRIGPIAFWLFLAPTIFSGSVAIAGFVLDRLWKKRPSFLDTFYNRWWLFFLPLVVFTTCLLPPLLSASGNSRVYFPVWAGAALAPLSLWVLRSELVRNIALMALLVTASFQTYTNLKGLEMRMERSERLVVPDSQEAYLALIAARDYLDADQSESLRIGGVILNGVSPLGLRVLGVLRLHQKFSSAFGIARSEHLGLDPRLSWSRENIALLDVSDLREKIGIALDKYIDGVDLFILPVAETWPESVKPTRQAIYQLLPYITQYLSERDNVVEMGIQFHHRKITWVIYVVSKSS